MPIIQSRLIKCSFKNSLAYTEWTVVQLCTDPCAKVTKLSRSRKILIDFCLFEIPKGNNNIYKTRKKTKKYRH